MIYDSGRRLSLHFGLRQSSTNLAIEVNIADIDPNQSQRNPTLDRDYLIPTSPTLNDHSTTSSSLFE